MSPSIEGTRIKIYIKIGSHLLWLRMLDSLFCCSEFGFLDNVGLWFCFGYMSGDFACTVSQWLK